MVDLILESLGGASEQESASRKEKTAEGSRGVDLGLSSRTPDPRPSSKCMLLATPYALCPAGAMAMSSGERGCASSHLTLWRHCSDLEARLLVLEGATSGDLG